MFSSIFRKGCGIKAYLGSTSGDAVLLISSPGVQNSTGPNVTFVLHANLLQALMGWNGHWGDLKDLSGPHVPVCERRLSQLGQQIPNWNNHWGPILLLADEDKRLPNYRESKYLLLTAVSRQSLCISIKTCRLKKRDWLRSYNTSLSAGCRSELLQWGLACLDLPTPPQILLQDTAQRGVRNQIPLTLPKPQAQGITTGKGFALCSSVGINTTFPSSPCAQHLRTRVCKSSLWVLTTKSHFQLKRLPALQSETQPDCTSNCTLLPEWVRADKVTENSVTQLPGEPGLGPKPRALSLQGLHGTTWEIHAVGSSFVRQKGRGCNHSGNLGQTPGRFAYEINTVSVYSNY